MGAETSVLYQTIIAICKEQGYKVLDYLKEFFKQIIQGCCYYENLMSATIGIKATNKRKIYNPKLLNSSFRGAVTHLYLWDMSKLAAYCTTMPLNEGSDI